VRAHLARKKEQISRSPTGPLAPSATHSDNTNLKTLPAVLPNAMRLSISLVRWATRYAHLIGKGTELFAVKDWLGHKDIKSTREVRFRSKQRDSVAASVYGDEA
jgi:hypothetical protein